MRHRARRSSTQITCRHWARGRRRREREISPSRAGRASSVGKSYREGRGPAMGSLAFHFPGMALAPTRAMFHVLPRDSWLTKLRTIPRRWLVVGVAVGVVLLIAYSIAFLIDEPLRRYTEAK